LYSGGLWLAVTITPASAFVCFVKYARTGVGIVPCCKAVAAQAVMPAVNACCSMGEVVRVSWAVSIVFAFVWVARAWPIWRASCGVMVLLALPLMPLVPKSFVKGVSLFLLVFVVVVYSVCVCGA